MKTALLFGTNEQGGNIVTLDRTIFDSETFHAIIEQFRAAITSAEELPFEEWREEDTHVLYELAFNLYRIKDFPQAEIVFRKLCVMAPFETSHWQGLASSLQMQHRFTEALTPWGMAAFIEPKNAKPHLHAAECLFALGQIEQCQQALTAAKTQDEEDKFSEKIDKIYKKIEAVHA